MSDETKKTMRQLAMLPVLRLYPHPDNPPEGGCCR